MKKSVSFWIFLLVIVITLLSLNLFSQTNKVKISQADTTRSFSGYAWSSTIGWIDMSQVTVSSTGLVSGYGWSPNIGWIKFGGLSGFPTGGGTLGVNAILSGNTFTGWARACSGTVNKDCNSADRTDGWDGWISLGGTGYGVSLSTPGVTSTPLIGYAWGATNIGWIDMSGASLTNNTCPAGQVNDTTTGSCVAPCPDGSAPANGVCPNGLGAPTLSPPSLSGGNNCSISLSWTNISGATSYNIQKENPDSSISNFSNIGVTSFTDSLGQPGSTYTYSVAACVVAECSPYSNTESITVPASCPPPGTGTGPVIGPLVASPATIASGGQCTLSWSSITNFDPTTGTSTLIKDGGVSDGNILQNEYGPLNSGSTTRNNIMYTTHYKLSVTNAAGQNAVSNTATCNVSGQAKEF